jgi:hypothetical protein
LKENTSKEKLETERELEVVLKMHKKKKITNWEDTLQIGQLTLRATALASIWDPFGFWFFSAFRLCASIFCFPLVILFSEFSLSLWDSGMTNQLTGRKEDGKTEDMECFACIAVGPTVLV